MVVSGGIWELEMWSEAEAKLWWWWPLLSLLRLLPLDVAWLRCSGLDRAASWWRELPVGKTATQTRDSDGLGQFEMDNKERNHSVRDIRYGVIT